MKTTTNAAAPLTFKSDRAAKMAMTKAEKAYVAARGARQEAQHAYWRDAVNDRSETAEALASAEAAYTKALDHAEAVYAGARAQGFWVRSWHFGPNTTRDLIQANMD